MLHQRGQEICRFERYSDEIRNKGVYGLISGAVATPWNPWSTTAIKTIMDSFQPDVIHVHNTFPLISPSIFHAIGNSAAKVLTLHNYRLFCPAAVPMRNSQVCTECLSRHTVIPALRHGCYRDSRLATLPLAINVALHRKLKTWVQYVDAFITLTEFQREQMIGGGLPADLVYVKPNFFPGTPNVVPWAERKPYVVFAGRLTSEKGLKTLVKAWILWGVGAPELRIIGDGDLRSELERLAEAAPQPTIRFLGQLNEDRTQKEISLARLLVLPSECYEGFPMVIREAFAFGTPVVASDIGPLPSIVHHGENGVVFVPGDPQSLLQAVQSVWGSGNILQRIAQGSRRSYERLYTEKANYDQLMAIYKHAIDVNKKRGSCVRRKV